MCNQSTCTGTGYAIEFLTYGNFFGLTFQKRRKSGIHCLGFDLTVSLHTQQNTHTPLSSTQRHHDGENVGLSSSTIVVHHCGVFTAQLGGGGGGGLLASSAAAESPRSGSGSMLLHL